MRLSISNIAWNNEELEPHLKLLRDLGCNGVEIAPSAIWEEPTKATVSDIRYIRKLVKRYNLKIPSFHALLYGKPELSIFKDKSTRNQTVSYIKKLIRLAQNLSVKVLVYGSPNSRKVEERSYEECYKIAVDTFKELAEECRVYDTCLCIEPLESAKTNFIVNSDEGYNIVKDVDDTGFRLHLDTGAMHNSKEDFKKAFKKCKDILKHVHLNDPNLTPPGTNGIDHYIIAEALKASGYDNYVSIEMRRHDHSNLKLIMDSISYAKKNYVQR